LKKTLVTILLSLILLSAYPFSFIPDHVTRPSSLAMNQLTWIREKFGFNNDSIAVIVSRELAPATGEGISDYYEWAVATLGKVIYLGTLFDILQGFPAVYNPLPNWKSVIRPPGHIYHRRILLPDCWYCLSPLELAVSKEIGPGIYEVLVKDLVSLEAFLCNSSSFFVDNTSLFRVVAGWGNFVWEIDNESDFGFWVSPVCSDAWFGVEVDLTREIGFRWGLTYVVLKVFGENVSGVFRVFVQVFDDYGEIAEREITDLLNGGYILVPVIVPSDKAVWRVRLSLQSLMATGRQFHFRIEYVALI